MAKLSLEALDNVSGGMDVRTLQTHIGAGGSQLSQPGAGPGFAPLLGQQFGQDAGLDPGLGGNMGVGQYGPQMPTQGLDPYAQAMPYGQQMPQMPYGQQMPYMQQQMQPQMMMAPPQERESTFAENVQAIGGIMGAFASMIGQFTGGAQQGGAPAAGRMMGPQGGEQGEQMEPGMEPQQGGEMQEQQGEPMEQGAPPTSSSDEVSGGNTNFRETATGFTRT